MSHINNEINVTRNVYNSSSTKDDLMFIIFIWNFLISFSFHKKQYNYFFHVDCPIMIYGI